MSTRAILQIAPTPFFSDRGCHIRIEGIVNCLSELGFENTVCTYHHGRDVGNVKTRRIDPIKNYVQTQAGPSKYKLWADWKLLWLCVAQYRKIKPVAIHAHLHEGVLIGLLVKWLFFWRRTPLIADLQGSLTGELDSHNAFSKLFFLRWPTKVLEKFLMLCANHITCSSHHCLTIISEGFRVNPKKISLTQDGANAPAALPSGYKSELIKKHQLPTDKILVIYSGALLESKGLNELKAIIKAGANTAVHFIIIGYPDDKLKPYLQQHQLEPFCTLFGQVKFENLPNILQIADIAIDPKYSEAGEGSGKILNYLACGLPVIAFNTQNNREFLPDASTLASSVDEFIRLLLELSADTPLRESVARKNQTQFTNHYSWQITQTQLDKIYRSVL